MIFRSLRHFKYTAVGNSQKLAVTDLFPYRPSQPTELYKPWSSIYFGLMLADHQKTCGSAPHWSYIPRQSLEICSPFLFHCPLEVQIVSTDGSTRRNGKVITTFSNTKNSKSHKTAIKSETGWVFSCLWPTTLIKLSRQVVTGKLEISSRLIDLGRLVVDGLINRGDTGGWMFWAKPMTGEEA